MNMKNLNKEQREEVLKEVIALIFEGYSATNACKIAAYNHNFEGYKDLYMSLMRYRRKLVIRGEVELAREIDEKVKENMSFTRASMSKSSKRHYEEVRANIESLAVEFINGKNLYEIAKEQQISEKVLRAYLNDIAQTNPQLYVLVADRLRCVCGRKIETVEDVNYPPVEIIKELVYEYDNSECDSLMEFLRNKSSIISKEISNTVLYHEICKYVTHNPECMPNKKSSRGRKYIPSANADTEMYCDIVVEYCNLIESGISISISAISMRKNVSESKIRYFANSKLKNIDMELYNRYKMCTMINGHIYSRVHKLV